MEKLLKIELNENQEPIISGRELHERLEVNSNYTTWFKRMCEYGFIENIDFITCFPNLETDLHGGQNKVDHAIKLDMAKEIAMLQRSEKGKEIRQYFIQVEKEYNSPEKIMARALHIANNQINNLKLTNSELEETIKNQKPKVLFAEAVETSETSILVGELAKILKQKGLDVGQNKLFELLRQDGYLMKQGSSKNMPTQKAMDIGLFEIKESIVAQPNGTTRVTKTPKVTGKGQVYFVNRYLQLAI